MGRRFRSPPRRSPNRPKGGDTDACLTVLRDAPDGEQTLEYRLYVTGRYQPERPAPACSDHDSPLFDDCGDAEEFELDKVEIEEIEDEDGKLVVEGHKYFGKTIAADKLELTEPELRELQNIAGDNYSPPPEYDDDDSGWEEWAGRED